MVFTAEPRHLVDITFGDKAFRATQITYANLLDTQAALERAHPGAQIHVIQPCWNTTVEASAGTHDKDAVLDVSITALSWPDAQTFLRLHGWAAWWRHTGDWASPSLWHIHMVSLGAFKAGVPVGIFVPGQVEDYYAHRSGLVGHVADRTPHPPNIDATVFDYRKWRLDMPFSDWPKGDQKALTDAVARAVLDSPMNALAQGGTKAFDGMSVRDVIKRIATKLGAV